MTANLSTQSPCGGVMTSLGIFSALVSTAMSGLRLEGFSEEEKRRLVDNVFEDNIEFLSQELDADQYVNALRSKRSLRPDHAEEIFQATTRTKKNNILLPALRRSDDPLRALSNLIDVVTDKGYQPHVVKRLAQSFARRKKTERESKGLPGNHAALTQPLSSPHNTRDTPPTGRDPSGHHTADRPPATAPPLSRERSGSGSTVSAVESVGFCEDAQGLVVSRAPLLDSRQNTGPQPPPSVRSQPPPSIRSQPPPSVHSQPPPSVLSHSSGWSADLESQTGSGPFPPNPGPLYEDRKDGVGPRPHSPAPLSHNGEESNDRYSNVDPEFGEMPPRPPPIANPDVDHDGTHYSPAVVPHWGNQVLNNSLPMTHQSPRASPGPTLIFPPLGPPLDLTSGSSSTSSISFTAIQSRVNELERTAETLEVENHQLRQDNAQLQQRVAWLERELQHYHTTIPYTLDTHNS